MPKSLRKKGKRYIIAVAIILLLSWQLFYASQERTHMSVVYLDNSATTMMCKEAAQKAMEAMTVNYGNPSSLHAMGIEAEKIISSARVQIAESLN